MDPTSFALISAFVAGLAYLAGQTIGSRDGYRRGYACGRADGLKCDR